MHKVML